MVRIHFLLIVVAMMTYACSRAEEVPNLHSDKPVQEQLLEGEQGRPSKIPTFKMEEGALDSDSKVLQLYTLEGNAYKIHSFLNDEKPDLFITSSLTCPISRDNCSGVNQLHKKYGKDINIVVIYTCEAHPKGSPSPYSDQEWLTNRNVVDGILVGEPQTLAERLARAKAYRDKMKITAPLLVDNMENSVWKLFGGGPNVGVLVNKRRKIEKFQSWLSVPDMDLRARLFQAELKNEQYDEKMNEIKLTHWDWSKIVTGDDFEKIKRHVKEHPWFLRYQAARDRGGYQREGVLHLVIAKNSSKHLEFYLKLGLDVESINYKGDTALHLASLKNRELVNILLKYGADPNVFNKAGLTPVDNALMGAKVEVAKLLLNNGAELDIKSAAGIGDLHTVKNYLDLYKLKPDFLNKKGFSALKAAVINGHIEIVELLVKAGVAVERDELNRPPLRYALTHNRINIAKLLLEAGANPSKYYGNYFYTTIVHDAAYSDKNDKFLELVLTFNPKADMLDSGGTRPIHFAVMRGSVERVKMLVKHGANIKARTGSPMAHPCGPPNFDDRPVLENAIHIAVENEQYNMLQYLLEQKVPHSLRTRDGTTPLDFAIAYKQEKYIKLLKTYGAQEGGGVKIED